MSETRAQGKTLKEFGEAAGYPPKNAAQSAYQALAGLRGRMTALLDEAGLGEKVAIENYLKPALDTLVAVRQGNVCEGFQRSYHDKKREQVVNTLEVAE